MSDSLNTMARTYERVTGRQSYLYAYAPTPADTRYVFADTVLYDRYTAVEYMRTLLNNERAYETEGLYDALRHDADLRMHTNRLRARANAHAADDDTLGATIIQNLMDAYDTFHPETGESDVDYGRADHYSIIDALRAATVDIGESDTQHLDGCVNARMLGRMIRHTHDEDLARNGMLA